MNLRNKDIFRLIDPAAAPKLLQSCQTLCDPIDGSPPGPTVPGILQARTLEWVNTSVQILVYFGDNIINGSAFYM